MSNLLESFPTVDSKLIEKMEYKIENVFFEYEKNGEARNLAMTPAGDNIYYLDDEYSSWNPLENNLKIIISIKISNKNILFDSKEGIQDENSTIGVALNYYCRKTNLNYSKKIGTIKRDEENEIIIDEIICFEKGKLADKLGVKIELFLENDNNSKVFANKSGTILGSLTSFLVMLEGKGSTFPIKIINENNDLLWSAHFDFEDVFEEKFSSDTVCLYLNSGHKDFKYLDTEGGNITPLMKEIITEFLMLFINKIIEQGNDLNEVCSYEYDEIDSIGNIVKFWVNSFDIDTNSIENILSSTKKKVDELIG